MAPDNSGNRTVKQPARISQSPISIQYEEFNHTSKAFLWAPIYHGNASQDPTMPSGRTLSNWPTKPGSPSGSCTPLGRCLDTPLSAATIPRPESDLWFASHGRGTRPRPWRGVQHLMFRFGHRQTVWIRDPSSIARGTTPTRAASIWPKRRMDRFSGRRTTGFTVSDFKVCSSQIARIAKRQATYRARWCIRSRFTV